MCGVGVDWKEFLFSPWKRVNLCGRHLHCLAAVLNTCIHRDTAFPPSPSIVFSHLNEELQKTSQIKVQYFIFNYGVFFRLNKLQSWHIVWYRCCTDHYRSSMPECPPYVKQLQVTQPPLRPHFWRLDLDLDLTVPKNPQREKSPLYNCQRHHLVQQKRGKNGKENAKPEMKPWLERGTPRTDLPIYCH